MHQSDPAGVLRKLPSLLRRGGIVVFQESDISGAGSFRQSQSFEQFLN